MNEDDFKKQERAQLNRKDLKETNSLRDHDFKSKERTDADSLENTTTELNNEAKSVTFNETKSAEDKVILTGVLVRDFEEKETKNGKLFNSSQIVIENNGVKEYKNIQVWGATIANVNNQKVEAGDTLKITANKTVTDFTNAKGANVKYENYIVKDVSIIAKNNLDTIIGIVSKEAELKDIGKTKMLTVLVREVDKVTGIPLLNEKKEPIYTSLSISENDSKSIKNSFEKGELLKVRGTLKLNESNGITYRNLFPVTIAPHNFQIAGVVSQPVQTIPTDKGVIFTMSIAHNAKEGTTYTNIVSTQNNIAEFKKGDSVKLNGHFDNYKPKGNGADELKNQDIKTQFIVSSAELVSEKQYLKGMVTSEINIEHKDEAKTLVNRASFQFKAEGSNETHYIQIIPRQLEKVQEQIKNGLTTEITVGKSVVVKDDKTYVNLTFHRLGGEQVKEKIEAPLKVAPVKKDVKAKKETTAKTAKVAKEDAPVEKKKATKKVKM